MDGNAMAIIYAKCEKCEHNFSYEPLMFNGMEIFKRRFCEVCNDQMAQEFVNKERDKVRYIWEQDWLQVCPPLYQNTDPAKIDKECAAAAFNWNPKGEKGLGLIGTTGRGKTRALFLALRKAYDVEKSCRYVTHNEFTRVVQKAFAGSSDEKRDNNELLKYYRQCGVLLLDDLGKPPPTERADAEFEELIEHRMSYFLPILWSANGSSTWLEQRLGVDRGPAIVRRLSESSTVVTTA